MKIFLYAASAAIIGFSYFLVRGGGAFPFVLLFCVVPIIAATYLYGVVWAYLFSAFFSAFCIGLIKLGVSPYAVFAAVVNFNVTPLVVLKFNNMLQNRRQANNNRVAEAERFYRELLKQDEAVKAFNAQIEKDVSEMARLYEITKSMSASLEFSGIFAVLKDILQRIFVFKAAKLLIFSQEQPGPGAGFTIKSYRISPSESVAAGGAKGAEPPDDFDRALAALYANGQRQALFYKRGGDAPLPQGLVLDEGAEAFAATGFFHEDKPSAILAVWDLKEEQKERFLIVASQFGLQIEKAQLYATVQQLAIIDGLTGIFVRRHLLERCQEELRRSLKHKSNLSCLVADIDFFKECNDKYGHLVGDVVLRQIADLIKANIREVDFAGRLGGEEFCVVLPDTPAEGAVHVGERLRLAVQQHTFEAYDEKVKATISVGAAVFPQDASDLSQLLDCADQAMYRAKAEGRNKVCAWKNTQ